VGNLLGAVILITRVRITIKIICIVIERVCVVIKFDLQVLGHLHSLLNSYLVANIGIGSHRSDTFASFHLSLFYRIHDLVRKHVLSGKGSSR
jgi:hypothetical protein